MKSGMQKAKQILSTAVLSKELIAEANLHGIEIDEISFIETKRNKNEITVNKIKNYLTRNITAVFTSANAVASVADHLEQKLSWKIYCVGNTTKKLIQSTFGKNSVTDTADNAEQLAEKIFLNKIRSIVFFCGNKRRDELPNKMKEHNISVEEVIVYDTIETPAILKKKYDGILFFSPTAVHSFFSVNHIDDATPIFVIGATTAQAITQFGKKNITTLESPSKENLVKKMISYFTQPQTKQAI
jgi:uroporphyrinogen-III synthase